MEKASANESKVDIGARENATSLWSNHSCGKVDGDGHGREYFEAVEDSRYLQQNWQKEYFGFNDFAGRRVLEIGIGHGTDILQFAKGGALCHGIDITQAHIDLTCRNFESRGCTIEIKKADAANIPYPNGYFDCVYSFGVLHHVPEMGRCIAEINRVLKPGGTFYMALYNKWSLFHLVSKLFYQGILKRDLLRLGYRGLLSTIETGADGRSIKPYVRLYSRWEVRALLRDNWDVQDISCMQLESSHLNRFSRLLPKSIAKKLHRKKHALGWYLASTASKRSPAPKQLERLQT